MRTKEASRLTCQQSLINKSFKSNTSRLINKTPEKHLPNQSQILELSKIDNEEAENVEADNEEENQEGYENEGEDQNDNNEDFIENANDNNDSK